MKHNNFVSVAVLALFVAGVAGARVEAEYSGETGAYPSTQYQYNTAPVAAPMPAGPTQPAAVVAAQPVYGSPYDPVGSAYAPTYSPAVQAAPGEYGDATSLTAVKAHERKNDIRLTPMIGSGDYIGPWSLNVKNNISFGLLTEFQTHSPLGLELEGAYSNYSLAYTSLAAPNLGYFFPMLMAHNFDQFSGGANAKLYLFSGMFKPYVGGGMQAIYFAGMQRRLPGPGNAIQVYDYILGAGQLLAGADVAVSREVAIGVRGSVLIPLLNKAITQGNGQNSAPGFEENALINTAYYRIMGSVSVEL